MKNIVYLNNNLFYSEKRKNILIREILKWFLLICFIISFNFIVFNWQYFFNGNKNLTMDLFLKKYTFALEQANLINITRSTIFLFLFTNSFFVNLFNLLNLKNNLKSYLPFYIVYFLISLLSLLAFFLVKIEDVDTIFYLSLSLPIWILISQSINFFIKKSENKNMPYFKTEIIMLIISYLVKVISFLLLSIIFLIFIKSSEKPELVFRKNQMIITIDLILSNLDQGINWIYIFLIIFITLFLIIVSNLHFLVYLRRVWKNNTKWEAIFFYGLSVFVFSFIFLFVNTFKDFKNVDFLSNYELHFLYIYIAGSINILILLMWFIFTNKKMFPFLFNNDVIKLFALIFFSFISLSFLIILNLLNNFEKENYFNMVISFATIAIMVSTLIIKKSTIFNGPQGFLLGTFLLFISSLAISLAIKNVLYNEGNQVDLNTLFLNYDDLVIFIIALLNFVYICTFIIFISWKLLPLKKKDKSIRKVKNVKKVV